MGKTEYNKEYFILPPRSNDINFGKEGPIQYTENTVISREQRRTE